MDELDPYRNMPLPSEEESSLLPSGDSIEHFIGNSGMNGGSRESHPEMRTIRLDNGIGQGGHTMERRERGALSAQVRFLRVGRLLRGDFIGVLIQLALDQSRTFHFQQTQKCSLMHKRMQP